MGIAYIRNYYGVPAQRGHRIIADGQPGIITGTWDASLRIRLDGASYSEPWHPTWHMQYLTADGTVLWADPELGVRGTLQPDELGSDLTTYRVTFDRIGRNHAVPPLVAEAADLDSLTHAIYHYARARLRSQDVSVQLDASGERGAILCGFHNGGQFTVEQVAAVAA